MSSTKLYIDCRGGKGVEFISKTLEALGYQYGYFRYFTGLGYKVSTYQRRAFSNMPFITVSRELKVYSGSKGYCQGNTWVRWDEVTLDMLAPIEKPYTESEANSIAKDIESKIEKRNTWINNRREQIEVLEEVRDAILNVETREEFLELRTTVNSMG